jgi:hypothetical protein
VSNTSNWDEEAEIIRKRESEEIRYTSRISILFSVILLVGVSVVFGLIQLVRCGLMGESLLPAKTDIYWFAGTIIWIVLLPPVFERWAEMRKLRAQRLIRLEMKIDVLLDKHERIDSNFSELKDEVREAYRNG